MRPQLLPFTLHIEGRALHKWQYNLHKPINKDLDKAIDDLAAVENAIINRAFEIWNANNKPSEVTVSRI